MRTIFVTGGAGFIGSNFVLQQCAATSDKIINIDALTYAGNLQNLHSLQGNPQHVFVKADIGDAEKMALLFAQYQPDAVVNFAAESHLDRSIEGPSAFLQTNVVGAFTLLEAARAYWSTLSATKAQAFRFLQVSTDEVYGALKEDEAPFTEAHAFRANNPYSASKAASDLFSRAYHATYGLPVLHTHCCNNYGPYQYPEKLMPLTITRALAGQAIPLFGDGLQVRDWIYVEDHCRGVARVLESGTPGETYNIGASQERTNRQVVYGICDLLDLKMPRNDGRSYREQIEFVKDRLGHDKRYAIDASKIRHTLNWTPQENFDSGIAKTVAWYLAHQNWVAQITGSGARETAVRVEKQGLLSADAPPIAIKACAE